MMTNKDNLTIQVSSLEAGNAKWFLYDKSGRLVRTEPMKLIQGTNQIQFSMIGIPKGIYTLNVTWGNNNKTFKLVKFE